MNLHTCSLLDTSSSTYSNNLARYSVVPISYDQNPGLTPQKSKTDQWALKMGSSTLQKQLILLGHKSASDNDSILMK